MKVFKSESGKQAIYESYDVLLVDWSVDYEETDVPGRYGVTHVEKAGSPDNPPLLLFHGVGDNSAMMWVHNAEELSKYYRIYAIDTIGGPGKSVPGSAYGRDFNQVEWIRDLMNFLNIEHAYAAGVSYGCYLIQLLLAELPERITKAVGMAGTISAEGSKSNALKMMSAFLPEALFPTDRNVKKLVNKLSGENSKRLIEDSHIMEHWKLLLRQFNNMSMGYHRIRKLPMEKVNLIRDNLLLLIGNRDILSYYPNSLEMLEKSKINFRIMEGCGHSVNHENPEEINALIIEFLS